jgi:hypothetical protein
MIRFHYKFSKCINKLTYVDPEGDSINILNSIELDEAIRLARQDGNILKINLSFSEGDLPKKIEEVEKFIDQQKSENVEKTNPNLENEPTEKTEKEKEIRISTDIQEIYKLELTKQAGETNDQLSKISKKMAENNKNFSDSIYENIKQQITSESPKEYKQDFDNLSVSMKMGIEKANNFVNNVKEDILKNFENSERSSQIFENIKKTSESTKNNLSNFANEANNKVDVFCENYKVDN